MTAHPRRRLSRGDDLHKLAESAMRAVIVVGWFGFAAMLLVSVLRAAP